MNLERSLCHCTDPQQNGLLFQKALIQGSTTGWTEIHHVYLPLVRQWVSGHPCFAATGENMDYFATQALMKMELALTPDKVGALDSASALLVYLQMCVHSVIVDYLRR